MVNERQPSAVEWLRKMDAGEISAVDLVQQTAVRIEAADKRVHAVVAEDPERRLADAKAADGRRARGETAPLLGLPVTIKDSIDVAGLPCTGGSYARENFMPEDDATCVARLRAAGAVIMAKTNVPEYSSSYESDNAIFGRTDHPLDPNRTAGGSSGGEGALLGADASIAGVGIDGGGSIRVPSHYCGTVGIRPTVGRIPDTGTWPDTRDVGYRDLMNVGPMCRYVEDLALMLAIMAGPDWIDPYALPVPLGEPADVDIKQLRVGYYDVDGVAQPSPGTRDAVQNAVQALAAAGAAISEAKLPDVKNATGLFFSLIAADGGARTLRDLEGADGRHHPQFQTLLDGFGEPTTVTDFFDRQRSLFEFRSRMRLFMEDYDVLVCPVATGPAPLHMQPPWGIPEEEYFQYAGFNYVHTHAVAGLPSTVVPAGVEDGMPIGVQIVAQAYREDRSLAAAAAVEAALGGFNPGAPAA